MNESNRSHRVPRLRLRYGESEAEIVDIGWSPLPEEEDDDPWTIAFLVDRPHPQAKQTWDVEDPTDPDNEQYPPQEASELNAGAFIQCAASHWQRVHPRMRRFTETELEQAGLLGRLGAVEEALKILVEARHGECGYLLEQHSTHQ